MGRLTTSVVFAVLIAVPVGCSDDQSGNAETVTLTATVTEAPSLDRDFFEGPPLEGVELCQADTTNCATTGTDGMASITLPASRELSFTISREGYVTYLAGDVTDEPMIATGNYPMVSDAIMQQEAERLMFEWPSSSTGLLALAAFPVHAGVTWEIAQASATAYYIDTMGVAQTDLSSTTGFGRGGFLEVSEGVHEVDFGGAVASCTARTAWPSDTANRVRVPVRAGYISFGSMDCDGP